MLVYYRDTANDPDDAAREMGRQFLCVRCFEECPFIASTQWTPEDTEHLTGWGDCLICLDGLFDTTADPDALFSPYRNVR